MFGEFSQHVAGALPDCDRNDQRGIAVDSAKDLDTPGLPVDESMPEYRIGTMSPHHAPAHPNEGVNHPCFKIGLNRLAHLIGGETRTSARHQHDLLFTHGRYETPLPMGYSSLTLTGSLPDGFKSPVMARMNDEK